MWLRLVIISTGILIGLSSCRKESVRSSVGGNAGISSPIPDYRDSLCNDYMLCIPQHPFNRVFHLEINYGDRAFAFGAGTISGDFLFYGGGIEEGYGGTVNTIHVLHLKYNNWTTFKLSVGRSNLAAATAGNVALFAGGNSKGIFIEPYPFPITYYDEVDMYRTPDLTSKTARLSEKRSDMATISNENSAWFIGGKTATGYSSKIDVYDAKLDSWHTFDMPRERAYAGAVQVNNNIYISGGQNSAGPLLVMDVYDLATGQWSELHTAHEHPYAGSVFFDNKIFVCGGDRKQNRFVDIFNPATESWSSVEISDSRDKMAIGYTKNKLILFGGNYSDKIDIYDSEKGNWTVHKLNTGVTGATGLSYGDICYFIGLLLHNGQVTANNVLVIDP